MPKNREGAKKISISRHSRCFLIRIQFIFTHIFHYTARKMIDSMRNPTQHRAYFGTNKKAKIIFLFFCCSFAHTWEKHIFPCRQQTHNMCGRTERVEGGAGSINISYLWKFSFRHFVLPLCFMGQFPKGFLCASLCVWDGGGWGTELFLDLGRFFNWKIEFCWTKKLQNGREELMNGFRTNFSKNFWRPLEAGKKEFKIVLLAILSKSPSKVWP